MCELDSAVMNGTAAPLANPGDITFNGKVLTRWSPRWILGKLHFTLIDVLDWFRALGGYWYGIKLGIVHGRESPGCGLSRAPIELRFDPVRGEHFYCTGCQRPIHFSGVERDTD